MYLTRNWGELQYAQESWQNINFPGTQRHDCLLGMGEEMLYEYIDGRTKNDKLDAIADSTIFMLGYCNTNGIDFRKSILRPLPSFGDFEESYGYCFGMLCQSHLKKQQGIRKNSIDYDKQAHKALAGMYLVLKQKLNTIDPSTNIFKLAKNAFLNTVSKRDWKRNKLTGLGE